MACTYDRRLAVLLCALVFSVTLAVFWPATRYDFVNYDDPQYVSENPHVVGGLSLGNVRWAFGSGYASNWHPLTWISHMLDVQVFGLQAGGHHLTNLLIHAVNAVMLFLALRRLTGGLWRCGFVAGMFALHPLHVESVAWISERKDVLSAFFFLLTLLAYAGCRGREFAPGGRRPKDYWLALGCFALGLLCKPMLVTTPFVLMLLDLWPLHRLPFPSRTNEYPGFARGLLALVREKIPFFVLTVLSCVITLIVQRSASVSFEGLPLPARVENALVAYVQYLWKWIWPAELSPFYPYVHQWEWWRVVGAAILLVVLSLAAWRGRERFPYGLIGWLWFVGMLVPVIGLVQVGSQAFADRYTYLPLVGPMLALTWLITEGGHAAVQRLSILIPRLAAPVRAWSQSAVWLTALAILALLGWRATFQTAFWENTGTLFARALVLAPDNTQALYALGGYLAETGHLEEGKALLEKAIQLRPSFPIALATLGNTFEEQGRYEDAVRFYTAALEAQPDDARILNNLAWLRASCPNRAFRNGAEAVRLATRACELSGYRTPVMIGTLAAAQAESGDFSAAVASAQRAIALASALHLVEIAQRNAGLMEWYRQGKSAHGDHP